MGTEADLKQTQTMIEDLDRRCLATVADARDTAAMNSVVENAVQSVRFEVLADAEPGLLPRVLVPFARRDLMPDHVRARRIGTAMQASLAIEAMPAEMVHLVEGNLRQIVGVRRVEVVLLATARQAA